jgi:hypothetical protein
MSELCKWLHEQLDQLPILSYPFDRKQLPRNGIYFLYEKGEIWGHGGTRSRIVRIGTHRGSNFQSRIGEHFLLNESKMDFDESKPKPSDRSILRKHIGRALLNREGDDYLDVWEKSFIPKKNRDRFKRQRDMKKEKKLEALISDILRTQFSFRFIIVEDQATRMGCRGLEGALISTVAQCGLCEPSARWLGRYSPKRQIRESGLWLVNCLGEPGLDESGKKIFAQALEATRK